MKEIILIVFILTLERHLTLPFARLLKKMKSYGIDGKLLSWVKSFLYERKQRVIVNESESEWTSVTSGIPQGSILGLTLFLI